MLSFLKNNEKAPDDVKQIRQQLLLFIKEQLRKTEGGEGASIKGLQLHMAAGEDQHLYEAAVYLNEPNRFKNEELQRIADDFALDLPKDWALELAFPEELPADAVKSKNLPVALSIITKRHVAAGQPKAAVIHVLTGSAEKENYEITPASGRIYIGRDKTGQTADGFLRENTIAFPSDSNNEQNKFVSRQHAHIEWDGESGSFCLFADEGGIPPRNKVKVQRNNGEQVRLQTMEIGHQLQPGDKIVLGGSVLLEFDYIREEA
jgi:pSer/pThr/pTyr-binding forkhead associated (FHA) protein